MRRPAVWKGGVRESAATLGNMSMSSGSPARCGVRPYVVTVVYVWLGCDIVVCVRPSQFVGVPVSLLVASRCWLSRHPGSDHATAAYPAGHTAYAADRLTALVPAAMHRGH